MRLTIFTPLYNRKDTIERLYRSLLKQKNRESFEWVIVDDGSTDGSGNLIEEFQKEKKIEITYKYTQNGGKMRAVNEGVKLAKGELFFIVDSDDYISDNCVELILKYANELPEKLGGLIFRKLDIQTGKVSGKSFPNLVMDSTPIEMVYNLGIIGDKAEIFKTELLRQNPFEVFEGEKFIPEATVWIKIGERYKMRYVDEPIYCFEYLEDGYTKNFYNLLKKNPKGFKKYYKEMLSYPIPFKNRVKFCIRYLQAWYYTFTTKGDRR